MTSVVATAGHVDHGKSTLVRALTGMEPDRLEEERRRGLSIELGYAWTTWSGPGEVAFVDVPGHRRFIRTTLAGLGPVPVVLLVVAADEGWKPQSAEHLAALDALGVRHGLLVITKCDRADPARASGQARQALARTTLASIREVAVSAVDGTGIDELVRRLEQVLARVPAPDPATPARLWVDRSFSVNGAGQVLTGTLAAGTISVGAELSTATGLRVRVRGLESLGRPLDSVRGTARVALNVRARDRVRRGQALFAPETHVVTTRLDASTRGGTGAAGAAVLHIGSTAVACRVRSLGERHVRITLAEPLPLHVGDRALVRDPGRPGSLVGLTVLDVRPPALTGRGAAVRRGSDLAWQATPADVAAHLLASRPQMTGNLAAMGLPVDGGIEVTPGWRVAPERWRTLGRRLGEAITARSERDPLDPPLSVSSIATLLDLPDYALVAPLAASVGVEVRHGAVETGEAGGTLPANVGAALDRLDRWFDANPFVAPSADQLTELDLDDRALAAAARAGRLVRLGPRLALAAGSDATAYERLARLPSPFRVTDVCAALGTSRRTAVPLLGLLDRTGRTRRLPDGRRAVVQSSTSSAGTRLTWNGEDVSER